MTTEVKIQDKFYSWASSKIRLKGSSLWLFLFFLSESFLFIPMDPVLMIYCLEAPSKRFFYALIATLSSTVTAILGYGLGYYLWDFLSPYVLDHLISSSFFSSIQSHYQNYESVAVALGSFLPIPFKAITLSAGVCKLSFSLFVLAVFIGRAARFFLLSELMMQYGERIKAFIQKYFSKFAAVGVKVLVVAALIWWLK